MEGAVNISEVTVDDNDDDDEEDEVEEVEDDDGTESACPSEEIEPRR